MNKLLLFAALSFLLASCSQLTNKISLNGEWDFLATNEIPDGKVIENSDLKWDTITVPGNWDTRKAYSEYVGKAYYNRTFSVPENWKHSQIRLKFDAVYETSKVWLNGELLGSHVGGYTPFEFNISSKVDFSGENTLVVMADNSYKRGAWWAWGGISRKVTLIRNEHVRLVHQHISATPDFSSNTVDFHLKYKVENNGSVSSTIDIQSHILNADLIPFKAINTQVQVDANSIEEGEIHFETKLAEVKLWHFDHPNLYELKTNLILDENVLDQASDKFGIRKLEAKGEQLVLNNEVVYMNGFNRVHDHPVYGNTEPDILIQQDILDMKALGTVFSRMMHAPLAKNILEFCDSIGYLIIEEIPVWGDDDPQVIANNPLTKQWLKEMIERDYNHACVVGWSVGNELRDSIAPWGKKLLTPIQFDYINSMLDYIDELDTIRLKTFVSLTSYSPKADKTNEPYDKVDLLCINSYGDGVKAANNTHNNFPGKPIFLSEIGIGQVGPAPEGALSEKLVNQLKGLKELPFVVGSSLWCYNDYRSNYKGTPASGFREWGVVNELRQPKKAYYQIKEIYTAK